MLTKEELKEKNQKFWSEFKNVMQKVHSKKGRRINWLNYPTEVKNIYLRMVVDSRGAKLCMDFQIKDDGLRDLVWEQMIELKVVLEKEMNHPTIWLKEFYNNEGLPISRIMWENTGVNFYNNNDHQEIFDFLKNRLIEFDSFYQEFKEILISLLD